MRIIGGILKGRSLKGKIPSEIRPTTDMVRESIFNILENFRTFDNLIIGDLCAGTGLLGFEALSRGGGQCIFVDKSINVVKFIQSTCESFGLESDKYTVIKKDVIRFLLNIHSDFPDFKFDIIFCDPPYHSFLLNKITGIIDEQHLLKHDGLFVAEHDDSEMILCPEGWYKLSERRFGSTIVQIFRLTAYKRE
jgi:16S rRNA (guanine966-N2)-methyltransferase